MVQTLKFNILEGFQKDKLIKEIGWGGAWGYDETLDIFWGVGGIAKLDYFLELFLNIIWLFLRSRYRI